MKYVSILAAALSFAAIGASGASAQSWVQRLQAPDDHIQTGPPPTPERCELRYNGFMLNARAIPLGAERWTLTVRGSDLRADLGGPFENQPYPVEVARLFVQDQYSADARYARANRPLVARLRVYGPAGRLVCRDDIVNR